MQYQDFLKRSQRVDFSFHPLNFQGHFLCDDPKTTFPPANPQSLSEPQLPNERQRYRARLIAEISSLTVPGKDHLKRYILHKFRNNCKRNTIRGTFTNAVKFLKFFQSYRHSQLETLRRCDIEAFVQFEQDRGMSAATLCTRLVCLYAFMRFLADEGVMSPELLKRKIHIKLPIKLPKSIEADDEDRILAQIDKARDKAMILLLLRTGMRIGELLKTTMQDISLQGQLIRIYESEKTGTGRVVFFSNDAAQALYQWLMKRDYWKKHLFHGPRDKAISYEAARAIFKKYVDKARLSHKGITLHCLRHTYATNLLNAGMHIEVLRDLLGHHSLEQTRRYANLADKTRKAQYFTTMAIIEGRKNK
jgi:site-specific recombinase XerD